MTFSSSFHNRVKVDSYRRWYSRGSYTSTIWLRHAFSDSVIQYTIRKPLWVLHTIPLIVEIIKSAIIELAPIQIKVHL